MKRFATLRAAVLGICVAGLGAGCEKEASTESSTTVSTPGGTTTVEKSTEVEQSGENPPPAPSTP